MFLLRKKVFTNPLLCIAFGFGSGLLPKMPGTWGTVVGVLIYLLMRPLPLIVYVLLVLLFFALGTWICSYSLRKLQLIDDHPSIVIDEMVGFLITMIAVPITFPWIIAGFIFFRYFDIKKPSLIRSVDTKIKGGFGIMFDDALAGVFSCLLLHGIHWIFII